MGPDPARLGRIMEVIIAATGGDYDQRIELEDVEDPLLEIELGVNFLLDELCLRREENETQTQALREQAARITRQSKTLVAALSTPIIVLWRGVLALPLIGEFDRHRAEVTTAVLLERVMSEPASHVILDLTGVESVSPDTASSLLRMIRTTELLGVTCLVTGVHPRAAQQFIELGPEATQLRTLARVSDALVAVLRDKGLTR